jgi:hypothetical protein
VTDGWAQSPLPASRLAGPPDGEETELSVDALAIAAAGLWLLAVGWCAVVTSRPRPPAGAEDPEMAPGRSALVNLSVTRCRLNGAAYPATILDLAAGGYLAITERGPGQLWCDMPASTPADTGLARSERLVLAGVRALAAGDGAPFEALAESCASDVRGRWDPFERAVRAEGRQAGITRPRLPVTARIALYGGAAGVGALAFAAVHTVPGAGLWAPAAAAFLAVAAPAYLVHWLGRQDQLTAHGSAVAAWADRAVADIGDLAAADSGNRAVADSGNGAVADAGDGAVADVAAAGPAGAGRPPGLVAAASPSGLRQLAQAVAAGAPVPVPGATPGLASGIRPGPGRAGARRGIPGQLARTSRPAAAWSSFGGQWRLVRIGPASSTRIHPVFWLVLAAWLALIAYVSTLLPGPAGVLVPAVLAVGSVAAVAGGARGLAAWRARPAETSFPAQVIARWVEHRSANDNDASVTRIALDDGERSWSFDVRGAASGQLALGDRVIVRASPRSGKLLSLVADQDERRGATAPGPPAPDEGGPAVPTSDAARPAPAPAGEGDEGAEPLGALLAAAEVSAAVGRPVQATGVTPRASTVYRGDGLTIIVKAADGVLRGLTSLARRRGRPLPEIGDEAWLLNRGRTAVLRVGGLTAKVTVGGSAARSLPPDALPRLAATVAERLPAHASSPRTRG